jgi:excisionase family DNA binding protein
MNQSLKPAVPTIAQALGVSASSAKRLIRDGLIPVVRVGRQYRIDEAELDRWVANGGAGGFKRRRILRREPATPAA